MKIHLRWLSAALLLVAALLVPSVANAATGFDASVPSSQLAFSSWGEYTPNKVSLGVDYGDPANRSVIRVTGVTVPRGSTVSGATLTVNAVAPSTDPASGGLNVKVAGVAADNPTLPTTAAAVKALPYTTARTTAWTSTAAAWTQGAHPAPSVAALVQEIVNRAGWASGNALEFVVYDNGSTGNGYFPGYGATLHVDYTAPSGTPTPTPGTDPGALQANSGRPFAATGPWNTTIPAGPVLTANSAAQVATIDGNVAGEFYAYGDPVFTATTSDPVASVTCTEPWGTCDPQAHPIRIPTNAQPTAGSDGALVVAEPDTNSVCDFWQVAKTGTSSYRASWATCDTLTDDDAVGPSGGSTGGNINVLAGVVRTFEVRQVTAGTIAMIPHALSLATGNSCSAFQYPAAKSDGGSGANCVPEGARLQLDPSINVDAIAGITPLEKAVAKTLQTYGAYNRDNCGSSLCMAFENPNGETDPYPAAGVPGDYWGMPHIPWSHLRVLRSFNGS